MSARICERCGASLEGRRPEARYCSGRCRIAASKARRQAGTDHASGDIARCREYAYQEPEPWVPKRIVAGHVGVSTRAIENYLTSGLPHLKLPGGHVRVRLSEAEAWLFGEVVGSRPARRPSATKKVKAKCGECGCTVWIARMWLGRGLPEHCGAPMRLAVGS